LIALDAQIQTSKRTIKADDFFQVQVGKTTILEDDEIVTEIRIPEPSHDTRSAFIKFALRKTIDFAIVNCAAMVTTSKGNVSDARICLNSVFVKPYRALKAEEALFGKPIDEASAETAGNAAVSEAKPLKDNGYMVQIAKALVKKCILALR
jgi:CO/xanthine dehydrogenase FAD-binding subunit